MRVYIVYGCWDYEGGIVLGIYKTKKAADKRAANPDKSFDWVEVKEVKTGTETFIRIP
jgi:hypothetical protein